LLSVACYQLSVDHVRVLNCTQLFDMMCDVSQPW